MLQLKYDVKITRKKIINCDSPHSEKEFLHVEGVRELELAAQGDYGVSLSGNIQTPPGQVSV